MKIYVYKRESRWTRAIFTVRYQWFRLKLRLSELKKATLLQIKRQELYLYSYTDKKVRIISGPMYFKAVMADFGETGFYTFNGQTHRCEEF